MNIIQGGITAALGFKAAGISAGLKKNNKKDMALIVSEVPATTAMMITQNNVKAAPVLWDQQIVQQSTYKSAIVVNSGNANACTGEQGLKDTQKTAQRAAELLHLKETDVLVSSTGVIGVPLPIEKILQGVTSLVPLLSDGEAANESAANSIITTDLQNKSIAVEVEIGGKTAHIGGIAKGSGMICPNMATMLSFVTTDVAVRAGCLQKMLAKITKDTYNMMSVDGDMSTNDTVIVLANGAIQNAEIIDEESPDYEAFYEALYYINETLAQKIIKDGEGATKFIEMKVKGTKTQDEARQLAKAVIQSSLVKTAMFGEDANWGRVLSSLGATGIAFDPLKVKLTFTSQKGAIKVLENGQPVNFDEGLAKKILTEKEIYIVAQLGEGDQEATAWGCDLSHEYVKINGEYRS